jgi:hypothetical protein
MDLLTTVRKEGSRGGRGDFKWEDVQSSSSRENYLGHSLMAPVGRWQKGRDLNWYAKGNTEKNDGETDADRAARERKEEIRQVKEAEQDALARALGFEVAPRNPNMEVLGNKKEVDRVLKEEVEDEGGQGGKGLGFGSLRTRGVRPEFGDDERIEGNAEKQDAELGKALREYKRRHGDDVESGQSKSNDRERRHHRHHDRDRDRDREYGRKSRSRSRSRERRPRGGRHAKGDGGDRPRNRSRSPHRRRHEREDRYRREDYDRRR